MSTAAFWSLAALMVAAALGGLLPPLLRRRPALTPAPEDTNLALLREQVAQLAADRDDGLLDATQYRQAHTELARRALEESDLPGRPVPAPAAAATARRSALAVALGVPLLALVVYQHLGDPAALSASAPLPAAADASPTSAATIAAATTAGLGAATDGAAPDIEAMVARLAQRLQDQPDDGPGWQMLARSFTALGRFDEASQAYARAARLSPDDAQLLADQADALAMAQGRSAAGEPTRLVERALKIDGNNLKALAIAGNAALERGDMAAARGYFQRARQLAPDPTPTTTPSTTSTGQKAP